MNKLILGTAIFSLSMFANATRADVTVSASSEQVTITADKSDVALAKSDCIKQTGTRIKASKDKKGCNGLPGNSYDRDDIERTGANTAGEALERLDPSIRISR